MAEAAAATGRPCHDIPIVFRATHLSSPPSLTLRLLERAALANGNGSRVYVVGCWDGRLPLLHGAVGVGLGSHPACSAAWRAKNLANPHARGRLAHLQPVWAAVELLTAEALSSAVLPARCRGTSGPGCTAFVMDPDVLLAHSSVRRACAYYDATAYDAVLGFAAPTARHRSLGKAVGGNTSAAHLAQLMGNRHVSFLAPRAMDALASLARAHFPTEDLDKGLDMLLPQLLPARGVSVLWLLEGCGMFIVPEGHCAPARLPHLDGEIGEIDGGGAAGGAAQYACTALLVAGESRGGEGSGEGGTAQPRCRLPASVGIWDAFLRVPSRLEPPRPLPAVRRALTLTSTQPPPSAGICCPTRNRASTSAATWRACPRCHATVKCVTTSTGGVGACRALRTVGRARARRGAARRGAWRSWRCLATGWCMVVR